MSVDTQLMDVFEAMQRERQREIATQAKSPLQGGGGGDNSDGMEVRIARLESDMEHVKNELHKLSPMPADLARVSERVNHLPTKAEMYEAIEAAIDRSSSRLQRTIAITGTMVAIVSGIITYLVKISG